MNIDPKPWPMFDVKTFCPLNAKEQAEIESACQGFNRHFNSHLIENYSQYEWKATALNLANLDYDFYEFGGGHWYHDNGYGFTCAWGQILVKSFGFQWMKMDGAANLRDWVLKSDQASYIFFPWQTLWSTVESSGYDQRKGVATWMKILRQVDAVLGVPTGWHPAIDAIRRSTYLIPKKVVTELRTLYDKSESFFELLELEPYFWEKKSDWEQIKNWIKQKQTEADGGFSNEH